MTYTILRLPEVTNRTGLSRSSIYLRITKNEFPNPISLGGRAVGWLEQDIDDWIVEKIELSRVNDHPHKFTKDGISNYTAITQHTVPSLEVDV